MDIQREAGTGAMTNKGCKGTENKVQSQKANKTVPTDQQGHFGWIKKDSTDMYKHWE